MSGTEAARWLDDFLRTWGTLHPILTPMWLFAIWFFLMKSPWK